MTREKSDTGTVQPLDGTEQFPVKIVGSERYHTHNKCYYIRDPISNVVEVDHTSGLKKCQRCEVLEDSGVPER